MTALHVVGECRALVFGLAPAARLGRQLGDLNGHVLVAHASSVLGGSSLEWLRCNPGKVLTSAGGRPVAILVPPDGVREARAAILGEAGPTSYPTVPIDSVPDMFVRKLRRREKLLVLSLEEESSDRVERLLFDSVYKGVTDLVTKWVWPMPAFWVTRACAALGIVPNAVTMLGMLLTVLAGWLFFQGDFLGGMIAAWLMTFLDTVDGKLARVTASSSKVGDILDHGTDYIHPPLWWLALGYGLEADHPLAADAVWISCWVILGTYVVGRLIENGFKKQLGFNQYIWRPFDSAFRLVVSRRNVILLIMSVGFLFGEPVAAFIVCAGWSIVSVIIQAVRWAQAWRVRPIRSWLM